MNPEAHGYSAGAHHEKDDFADELDDVLERDIPSVEIEEPSFEAETLPSNEVTPVSAETAKEERLGDYDERLRLLEIERESAARDMEQWKSSSTTNLDDFRYRLPDMKIRLSTAEQEIASSKLDRDLIVADANTPEAADEVVCSFIKNQVLEGMTKSQRDGLRSIDKEEATLQGKLEGYEKTIEYSSKLLDGEQAGAELPAWQRRDLMEKIHETSDMYETVLAQKVSSDFGGKRSELEAQMKAIQEQGVPDEALPKTVQEDPDFAACLREAEFSHSEDSEAFKRRTNHDPEKEAVAMFSKRFPHKAEFYSRLAAVAGEVERGQPQQEQEVLPQTKATSRYIENDESWRREAFDIKNGQANIKEEQLPMNESIVDSEEKHEVLPETEELEYARSIEGPPDPASVKEVMKRTGTFFVNTFAAHQMSGAIPYLQDTSFNRVVSASTIKPGKNFFGRVSGTYDTDGVILKDGTITSFDKEDSSTDKTGIVSLSSDSGMSTDAFLREGRREHNWSKLDKVAQRRVKHPKKNTALAYNEFVVRQPQTYGYFESMEPNKEGKIKLTNENLQSFRSRFAEAAKNNLPVFILTPEKNFIEVISIGDDGQLVLGETLRPEQVYAENGKVT